MSNNYHNSSDSSNPKPKETVVEPSFSNFQPKQTVDESSLNNSQPKETVVESNPIKAPAPRTPFVRQDPLEGKTIGDNSRYLLQTLLGQGGMSKVYQALDTKFEDRIVAIKLMTNYSAASGQHLIKRFMGEVKAISRLKHPNIIQILDYGITPDEAPFDGVPFYVMEYFSGSTLQDLLTEKKTLSLDSIINIFLQVCAGLKEAHQKGIVHRDLKPENIFLVAGGAVGDIVKIIDFGIAKNISSDSKNQTNLTQEGSFIGTYRYASPEQCRGLPNIDQRTDIYSLGVILYEAISGENPYNLEHNFSTSQADWVACHIRVDPKPLKEQSGCANIEDSLGNLVMKCLAKSPQDRFLNIGELEDALSNSFSLQRKENIDNNRILNRNKNDFKTTKEIQAIPHSTIEEKNSNSTNFVDTSSSGSHHPKETVVEPNPKSRKNIADDTHGYHSREQNSKKIFSVVNLAGIAIIFAGLIGTGIYFFNPQKTSNNSQNQVVTPENNSDNSVNTNDTSILIEILENEYNQRNYERCYQLAIDHPNQNDLQVADWLGKCGLEAAKIKAKANSYTGAIAIAQEIPDTVPNYQEVQANINIWSDKILDYADNIYREKGKAEAIKITNNLPEITNIQAKVAESIAKWEQTDKKYQSILNKAQQLLNEKAWYVAKQEVEKIPANFKFWSDKAQPILAKAKEGIKNYKPPTPPRQKPIFNRPPKQTNPSQPKKVLECEDGDIFNCR